MSENPSRILAIPNIILGLLIGLLQIMGFISPSSNISDIFYMTTGVILVLLFIAIIIVALVDSGIALNIIKNTINQNNILPELDIGNDLVMGLKSFIVILVYLMIPMIIYMIILFLFTAILGSYDYRVAGLFALIISLIFYVVAFIIAIFMPVILGTLAKTDSIEQALHVNDIINTAKQIGLVELFILIILIAIVGAVISLVGTFITFIPVVGSIITIGFLYTFILLFNSRCYGLIYNNQFEKQNQYAYNNQQYTQYPNQNYNPQYNQEQNYQQQAQNQQDNQVQNTQPENNPMDFNNTNTDTQTATKTCISCGFANPEYAQHCGNCGNKL